MKRDDVVVAMAIAGCIISLSLLLVVARLTSHIDVRFHEIDYDNCVQNCLLKNYYEIKTDLPQITTEECLIACSEMLKVGK